MKPCELFQIRRAADRREAAAQGMSVDAHKIRKIREEESKLLAIRFFQGMAFLPTISPEISDR